MRINRAFTQYMSEGFALDGSHINMCMRLRLIGYKFK